MLDAFALFLIAGIATHFGVAGVRRWALSHNALDIPNARSGHSRPTPRGGGLAVALVTILGWTALGIVFSSPTSRAALLAYAGGAGLIALVSWLDDLYSLSAATRFTAHIFAALAVVLALGPWQTISLAPGLELTLGYAGAAITLLWIVGLTNAFNFMDGSDGLAGSQALVAGLGWACLGWMNHLPAVEILALLLAAGSLGFLFHNWPPARIFMGDVGSAFLGYSFAVLPLLAQGENVRIAGAGPILGFLVVWPFIFDAAFTFLRRLRKGENVFAAHRSHLYQRLIIVGYSHRFVLLLYSGLAIAGTAAALCWCMRPVEVIWSSVVLVPALACALWGFVVGEERRALNTAPSPHILPMPSARASAAPVRKAA